MNRLGCIFEGSGEEAGLRVERQEPSCYQLRKEIRLLVKQQNPDGLDNCVMTKRICIL